MERLKELEADREERRGQAKEILDAASTDSRPLTEDEEKSLSTLNAELERIDATIRYENQRIEWDRVGNDVVNTPDGDAPPKRKVAGAPRGMGPNPWGDCSNERNTQASFGSFLQAVAKFAKEGTMDPRLVGSPQAASGLSTGVGSDGGFLVRTDFSTMLLDRAMYAAQLANRCTTIDIGENADGIELPYVDETSRATGSRWGGVQIYRRAEAATVTASKPKLGYFEIRLEDLMGICYATDRALRDATSLGQIITQAFTDEFSFTVDDEILNGDGAGKCLGLLNSSSHVTVAKETSQVAATVVAENVLKMRSRLWGRSRGRNWVWLINQDVEPQLPQMNIKIKNVAGSENVGGFGVYMPANGLAGQQYDTLSNSARRSAPRATSGPRT